MAPRIKPARLAFLRQLPDDPLFTAAELAEREAAFLGVHVTQTRKVSWAALLRYRGLGARRFQAVKARSAYHLSPAFFGATVKAVLLDGRPAAEALARAHPVPDDPLVALAREVLAADSLNEARIAAMVALVRIG